MISINSRYSVGRAPLSYLYHIFPENKEEWIKAFLVILTGLFHDEVRVTQEGEHFVYQVGETKIVSPHPPYKKK